MKMEYILNIKSPEKHEMGRWSMKQKIFSTKIILSIIVILFILAIILLNYYINSNIEPTEPFNLEPVNYTYQIINIYPHDDLAFTQGLVFENGFLYEGTGLRGKSTLRRVDLKTGNVLQIHNLSSDLFGEGITIFEEKIIQLTWKNNLGFVYNKDSFELLETFNYSNLGWGSLTEGWGLTNDDETLIMSVGNETLFFLNPKTFQVKNQINVYDKNGPVTMINELEYINGSIFANIWQKDVVAIINPQTGNVTGWIDFSDLKYMLNQVSYDVLNGIAYNPNNQTLFVTGKNWSKLFEVNLDVKK